jgi:redox-sensitive bicupin YhaK (pirin superfamily)
MTQIIAMHPMNIGNGFRGHALRGGQHAEPIDPFLGVDHAWVSVPTFPPHPHAGFSAVSYLLEDSETGVLNRDSLGTRNLIKAGGLHWTAAGRGIVHEEVPEVTGKAVHMLQIFVNLAVSKQSDAPFALSLAPEDVPILEWCGAKIRVPLGCLKGICSPLTPPTAVDLFDISLEAGAEVSIPLPSGKAAFVIPIDGFVEIDGVTFEASTAQLPVYPAQPEPSEISIRALQGSAKAVFFSGSPLRQPVHWKGSLALASEEALLESMMRFKRGEFGGLEILE